MKLFQHKYNLLATSSPRPYVSPEENETKFRGDEVDLLKLKQEADSFKISDSTKRTTIISGHMSLHSWCPLIRASTV